MVSPLYHLQYFTATISNWKHLLKPGKYKDVIMESLHFLVKDKPPAGASMQGWLKAWRTCAI